MERGSKAGRQPKVTELLLRLLSDAERAGDAGEEHQRGR